MVLTRADKLRTLSYLLIIYLIALVIQTTMYISGDVSWLMLVGKRLLAGGDYFHDFLETNPPLIIYLYLPVVLMLKVIPLSATLIFKAYIFILATLSLWACDQLCQKIFSTQQKSQRLALLLSLCWCYLVLPLHELGQRDHLMVILTMPYFLSLVCRGQGVKLPSSAWFAIGLSAALGFGLKPHFLIAPIMVELYSAYYRHSLKALFRIETWTMLGTMTVYALTTWWWLPDYYTFIVPLTWRLYYPGIAAPWIDIFPQPLTMLSFLPATLYWFCPIEKPRRLLNTILVLALVSFWLAYVLQRTFFFYHYLPVLSLTIITLSLFVTELSKYWVDKPKQGLTAGLLSLVFLASPLYHWVHIYLDILYHRRSLVVPLATYLRANAPHQSVAFLISTTIYTFPTIDRAEVSLGSRFPFMWTVSGLLRLDPNKPQVKADKKLIGDLFAADLNRYRPKLIIVDVGKAKGYIVDPKFDYQRYFADNPAFVSAWRAYHFKAKLADYPFAVYERN